MGRAIDRGAARSRSHQPLAGTGGLPAVSQPPCVKLRQPFGLRQTLMELLCIHPSQASTRPSADGSCIQFHLYCDDGHASQMRCNQSHLPIGLSTRARVLRGCGHSVLGQATSHGGCGFPQSIMWPEFPTGSAVCDADGTALLPSADRLPKGPNSREMLGDKDCTFGGQVSIVPRQQVGRATWHTRVRQLEA